MEVVKTAAVHNRKPNRADKTRKRSKCECIATWGCREPRVSVSALITTTCQYEVTEPIHCRMPHYSISVCWYITLHCGLDLWPWTFAVYCCDMMKLYQIWTQSSNPWWSFCYLNIWPNDLKRRVTCWAWLWDDFHQVWPSTTYVCVNYMVLCWYVMSCCHLDLWPWTFTALRLLCVYTVYKIWAKSNNPRLSYWRFITLSSCNFRGGYLYQVVLRAAWTQLLQTWQSHRAIIPTQEVCFWVWMPCCIFKRGRLKVEWCLNDAKFHTFWLLVWKLGERWARSLYQLLKLYWRTKQDRKFISN